jgi:hypothetical protein
VRSHFDVTESEFASKQTLYYRKPTWAVFRALSIRKLLSSQYKEISENEALKRMSNQQLGFSRLRLLPKKSGVRPIASLCKREILSLENKASATLFDDDVIIDDMPPTKRRQLNESVIRSRLGNSRWSSLFSTNSILNDAFAVLTYEHEQKEGSFGAGCAGLDDFYRR